MREGSPKNKSRSYHRALADGVYMGNRTLLIQINILDKGLNARNQCFPLPMNINIQFSTILRGIVMTESWNGRVE